MRITDLLKKEGIDLQGKSASKSETIDNLVDLMDATGNLNDKEGYKKRPLLPERNREQPESAKGSPSRMARQAL